MEEKIKQAFQEWKQADQPKENEMSNNRQLSNVLLDKIKDSPGITGKALRVYIAQGFPTTPVSYVPAILKGFYDNNIVSREGVPPEEGSMGRSTYAYTAIPEGERKKMPKREKVRAYTKKKTKAKPATDPNNSIGKFFNVNQAVPTASVAADGSAGSRITIHIDKP
jgi:hypothetical protein